MDDKTKYKIYVTTSNFADAGTKYNVCLQVFGVRHGAPSRRTGRVKSDLTSFKFPLEKSKNHAVKFQPGQKDKFEIEEIRLDKIKKIRLALLDNPLKTSWHVKKVVIKADDQKWTFEYKNWLKYSESSRQVECYIKPLKKDEEQAGENSSDEEKRENARTEVSEKVSKIRYDMKIKTSEYSKLEAPFHAINVKLVGKNGAETNVVKLNGDLSDEKKDKFVSGNTDVFYFEEVDVGMVEMLKIYCDYNEKGKLADWFFDEIVINIPSKLIRYRFDQKSKSQIIKEKGHSVTQVYPILEEKVSDKKFYCVNIYANAMNANRKLEIDKIISHLTLSIHGDFGSLDKKKPLVCKSHAPEKGRDDLSDQLIHFHIKSNELGSLHTIQIHYENKQLRQPENWFLKYIQVYYEKKEFYFQSKKWIKLDKEKKKVNLTLWEQNNNKKRTLTVLSHRLLQVEEKDPYEESGGFERDEDDYFDSRDRKNNHHRSTESLDRSSARKNHRSPHGSYGSFDDDIDSFRSRSISPKDSKHRLDLDFRKLDDDRNNNNKLPVFIKEKTSGRLDDRPRGGEKMNRKRFDDNDDLDEIEDRFESLGGGSRGKEYGFKREPMSDNKHRLGFVDDYEQAFASPPPHARKPFSFSKFN